MKKIIIDNALKDIVQQQVSVLASNNNKILYIESGREALAVHRKEQADIVIIKPDFPDMPCEQLCSDIRGDEGLRRVSILIVCSDNPSDIERCQKCGANDYIQPQTQTTFLRKVARLLNISERTSYRVIVRVAQREKNNMNHVFCTSQNISSSGILLETDSVLNQGDKITCSFFLPNSIRIVTEGEIVRIVEKEDGSKNYGVKFVDIPSLVESQIASFTENWLKSKKRFR
jgi:response regulator RpfG family c-di-GMP phosphodiesterase